MRSSGCLVGRPATPVAPPKRTLAFRVPQFGFRVGATHRRQQVFDGLLQVGIVRERKGRAHDVEAGLDEAVDIALRQVVQQALLDDQERCQLGFAAPAPGDAFRQQDVELNDQRVEAFHMLRGQFGHLGAAARQDVHQVAAFENQQRLADRAATDVEGLGDLLLLDTFPFLEFSPDDAFREVVGDLLCQAVRGLERHGDPFIQGRVFRGYMDGKCNTGRYPAGFPAKRRTERRLGWGRPAKGGQLSDNLTR